jgi:hypothetical protein
MDMTSEELRERMQRIRELRRDLNWYKGKYTSAKENLENYDKDYQKYVTALLQLASIQTEIGKGGQEVAIGNSKLPNYASGNKCNMASGVISSVVGMFGNTSASVENIKTFITKDMELLNEKYLAEYPKYSNAVDGYNRTANKLHSYGESCNKLVLSITKKKLQ